MNVFYDSIDDANKNYKNINKEPIKNLINSATHTFYGKATISLSEKLLNIAQLVSVIALATFSFGTLLLSKHFRDYLLHKYNTINEAHVYIYVKKSITVNEGNPVKNDHPVDNAKNSGVKNESLFTDKEEEYINQAILLFNQKNYKEVLQLCKHIRNDEIQRSFAVKCCRLGYYEASIDFIRTCSPSYVNQMKKEIFLQEAKKNFNYKNYDEALRLLKYLNSDSDTDELYLKIAQIYINQNRLYEASEVLSKVNENDKKKDLLLMLEEKRTGIK